MELGYPVPYCQPTNNSSNNKTTNWIDRNHITVLLELGYPVPYCQPTNSNKKTTTNRIDRNQITFLRELGYPVPYCQPTNSSSNNKYNRKWGRQKPDYVSQGIRLPCPLLSAYQQQQQQEN